MLSAVKELQQQLQQQKVEGPPEDYPDNPLELLIDAARRQLLTAVFRGCTMHKVEFVDQGRCELQGQVSDPSTSSSLENKRAQFILFCNHRWVESNVLKKSLESLPGICFKQQ
jgi:hypothetical protein